MALIDRTNMLSDVKLYLPEANALSDQILNNIINHVIDVLVPDGQTVPIDDDQFYSEDLCKSLKISAQLNKAKFAVDGSTTKREKVDEVEVEQFEASARFAWNDYIKSLSDTCPYLPGGGYSLPSTYGIKVNPSDKFIVDRCFCPYSTKSTLTSITKPCSSETIIYF